MTTLYFVRHGESVANLQTLFAGSMDTPLTERGRQQAASTAACLSNVAFSAVYASDLSRAYETGMCIARENNVPIYSTAQLREIDAGEWEGKFYRQLETEYADSYSVWRQQIGCAQCPGGESVAQLQSRIRAYVEDVVRRHPNETVCIATHATPIRVMECVWTDTALEQMHAIPWVSNASFTVAVYDSEGVGRLVERDSHKHLDDLHTILAKNI